MSEQRKSLEKTVQTESEFVLCGILLEDSTFSAQYELLEKADESGEFDLDLMKSMHGYRQGYQSKCESKGRTRGIITDVVYCKSGKDLNWNTADGSWDSHAFMRLLTYQEAVKLGKPAGIKETARYEPSED